MNPYVIEFGSLGIADVPTVGGKNASLGEMISNLSGLGITVPDGFATTAQAYREFLGQKALDQEIHDRLANLDVADVAIGELGLDQQAAAGRHDLHQRLV